MARIHDFTQGIFSIITQNIFFFIKSGFFFILSILPTLIWILFVERSMLDLLFLFLIGPAVSAICRLMIDYIETDFSKDDYPDGARYLHHYRKNFKESLTFWIPYCVLMFILMTNLQGYQWGHAYLQTAMTVVYVLFIALLTLFVGYFFLISSKYSFPIPSLFRLSMYYIFTWIKSTLGIVAVLFLTMASIYFFSEWPALLLSSPLAYILVRYAYPVLENVGEYFVKK
ncbi:MAG: DUF624 domain-containing protein [Turicibacter sp.]|nr:DUF624 domain-containing protein [Turicibacter sp.]